MKISENKLRKIIRSKLLKEFKQARTSSAYNYLSGLRLGGPGGISSDIYGLGDGSSLLSIPIEDLPSQVGRTANFVYQSVPCTTAVSIAKSEGGIWDSKGMFENQPEAQEYLKKYWDHVGSTYDSKWYDQSRWNISRYYSESKRSTMEHWSAAFISWVMDHESGLAEGPNWKNSSAHTTYINKAWKDRKKVEDNPGKYKGKVMWLAFTGEEIIGNGKKPPAASGTVQITTKQGNDLYQPGDLIGRRKGSKKVKSDGTPYPFEKIHFDVYVGDGKKVGGNTNNGNNKYCGDGGKTGPNGCGSSGLQSAASSRMTDVIKRVKIIGTEEDYKSIGGSLEVITPDIVGGGGSHPDEGGLDYNPLLPPGSYESTYDGLPAIGSVSLISEKGIEGIEYNKMEEYNNIKYGWYTFPDEIKVKGDAKDLIKSIGPEVLIHHDGKIDDMLTLNFYDRNVIVDAFENQDDSSIFTLGHADLVISQGDKNELLKFIKSTHGMDPSDPVFY